jgi:transposase-like protein
MQNKYYKNSHISEKKFREIIKYFAADLTAKTTANLTNVNYRTVKTIYQKIRLKIYENSLLDGQMSGVCEVDESYFGPTRVRGKRGRGAGNKTIVFGILEREGKVFTQIIPDAAKATIQAIIRKKISPETIVNSDGWAAYHGLVDLGYGHYRVRHGADEFAVGANHINGLESFWSYAKRRLAKFNGIQRAHYIYHLRETEFRFNNRHGNLYKILLQFLRKNPI